MNVFYEFDEPSVDPETNLLYDLVEIGGLSLKHQTLTLTYLLHRPT